MKLVRSLIRWSVMATAVLGVTVASSSAAQLPEALSKRPSPCQTAFALAIHQGPHAGIALVGTLTFSVDHKGELTGRLSNGSSPIVIFGSLPIPGNSVKVTGQVTGQAISMVFDLGHDNFVFGTGAAQSDLSACHGPLPGVLGGPAVGPADGDSGDWIGDWICRIPPISVTYCLYILLHG